MLNDVGVPGRSLGAEELPPAEIVLGTVSVELGSPAVPLAVALGVTEDADDAGAVAEAAGAEEEAGALSGVELSCADVSGGGAEVEPVELGVLDVLPDADAAWLAWELALPEGVGVADEAGSERETDAESDEVGESLCELCEGDEEAVDAEDALTTDVGSATPTSDAAADRTRESDSWLCRRSSFTSARPSSPDVAAAVEARSAREARSFTRVAARILGCAEAGWAG